MRPKEIKKLIELVEASSISELEVTRFGKKVRISKNSSTTTVTTSPPAANPLPAATPVQTEAQQAPPAPAPAKTEPAIADNIYEVKSPMVGTFYRAPAPDADPYVEVGDTVSQNQVLCIIEAMKLMNEIECEIRGKVVEILAENGKPVEYDQVLFRIEKI
ncbi:acetyl-CoA carboxylase, biotin carboxyl carrier protein [candidate division KSB1 bacterium 4484_87]|nr:MAG: acetyl-CoA carboxylase, biotin carboxyl carrier protein [candidate division KSB1 bacterium 4484_87]